MKVIELLEFSHELLLKLKRLGIRLDDCRFIGLYNEYKAMRKSGEKVTYIVSMLAEKYGISERKVYDLVKRLGAECLQQDPGRFA
jgi:hypothetical protein